MSTVIFAIKRTILNKYCCALVLRGLAGAAICGFLFQHKKIRLIFYTVQYARFRIAFTK